MHRTKTGKRLAFTDRDMEIFRALRRYRFLRSTYLHAFVGGASEKRFIERLGDLFHEGYLDRPAEQWRFADARCRPVVYELGKGGLASVGTESETDAVTWLHHSQPRQFEHSLMICEVLASIELATRGRDDIRFIPWPEILAKAPEATRRLAKPYVLSVVTGVTVVPDAIFGLEYRRDGRKSYRFFALEADRGTMPVVRSGRTGTSVVVKLEAYRTFLAQDGNLRMLGVPNLLVLTVTTDACRVEEVVTQFGEVAGEVPQFLFRAVAGSGVFVHPDTGLLSTPWQRPRLTSFRIDR